MLPEPTLEETALLKKLKDTIKQKKEDMKWLPISITILDLARSGATKDQPNSLYRLASIYDPDIERIYPYGEEAKIYLDTSTLVVKDPRTSRCFYERAAELGHREAQVRLKEIERFALPSSSLKISELADKRYALACEFEKNGELTNAIEQHMLAAAQGHVKSQCFIGDCYYQGNITDKTDKGYKCDKKDKVKFGFDRNESLSLYFYELAASQGYAPAEYSLYLHYVDRINMDKKLALHYCQRAADKSHAAAIHNLGQMHEEKGTPKSKKKALDNYKAADKLGFTDACYPIGNHYLAKAVLSYRRAADNGNNNAKDILDILSKKNDQLILYVPSDISEQLSPEKITKHVAMSS